MTYANQLGYVVKLLAVAERFEASASPDAPPTPVPASNDVALDVRVHPTLLPRSHPLAGVDGVNNAILVEGEPVGQVMFFGPGAGAGPTASAVVADILNIAGISQLGAPAGALDPLLAASRWRQCALVDSARTRHRNYVRLLTRDEAGVIGKIGTAFGTAGVSIQSIVQYEASGSASSSGSGAGSGAEIVVITHEVEESRFRQALAAITALPEVQTVAACLRTL